VTADDFDFAALSREITRTSGFALDAYKDKCIRRRIAVRMRACGVHTYEDYRMLLRRSPNEYERLRDALTINVTRFYRNAETWNLLRRFFHEDRAPEGLTFNKFLQTLQGMTDKRYGRGENEKAGFTYRTLMVAGMHFMDSYNYDVERVKRCVIHYAAPDGLIYPIARNADAGKSEFCGACFSPDGQVLFVNIQRPGVTFAITGDWSALRQQARAMT